MAVHVRCNSLYISLPSSGKQQREMTKFGVVWRAGTTTVIFFKILFQIIAVSQIKLRYNFDSDKQSEWLESTPRFVDKI